MGKSRTDLPSKRTARVLLCLYRESGWSRCTALSRKRRTTPNEDLALARKRQKELER